MDELHKPPLQSWAVKLEVDLHPTQGTLGFSTEALREPNELREQGAGKGMHREVAFRPDARAERGEHGLNKEKKNLSVLKSVSH